MTWGARLHQHTVANQQVAEFVLELKRTAEHSISTRTAEYSISTLYDTLMFTSKQLTGREHYGCLTTDMNLKVRELCILLGVLWTFKIKSSQKM